MAFNGKTNSGTGGKPQQTPQQAAGQVSGQQLNMLLGQLSQKLGANPDTLRQQIQNGNINQALHNLKPEDAQKVEKVLSDKQAAQKLLSSPQAQQLLQKLMGKK